MRLLLLLLALLWAQVAQAQGLPIRAAPAAPGWRIAVPAPRQGVAPARAWALPLPSAPPAGTPAWGSLGPGRGAAPYTPTVRQPPTAGSGIWVEAGTAARPSSTITPTLPRSGDRESTLELLRPVIERDLGMVRGTVSPGTAQADMVARVRAIYRDPAQADLIIARLTEEIREQQAWHARNVGGDGAVLQSLAQRAREDAGTRAGLQALRNNPGPRCEGALCVGPIWRGVGHAGDATGVTLRTGCCGAEATSVIPPVGIPGITPGLTLPTERNRAPGPRTTLFPNNADARTPDEVRAVEQARDNLHQNMARNPPPGFSPLR